jgi:hypothetical protein
MELISWWHHSKEKQKQRKILIFVENQDFLFFHKTTMIVQASVTSKFLRLSRYERSQPLRCEATQKSAVYQGIL